jgi:hypothetical protein
MTAFDDGLWARLVDEYAADRVALRAAPPQKRNRRLLIGGGGIGAVSLAGVFAAMLSLTGGASPAFAGWTPQPTAPTKAQLATANAYCAAHVPTPGLPLQLTDARGPFTFEIFANDTSNDFCITGPSFLNASGWSTDAPVQVPAGTLHLWDEHTTTTHAGQAYGFGIARSGADVSAATLTLDDGIAVTATVQNGWAVAWWPGNHQVTGAQLTTPSGTQTQTFPLSPCGHPLDRCGGGSHGAAPGGGPGGG